MIALNISQSILRTFPHVAIAVKQVSHHAMIYLLLVFLEKDGTTCEIRYCSALVGVSESSPIQREGI